MLTARTASQELSSTSLCQSSQFDGVEPVKVRRNASHTSDK